MEETSRLGFFLDFIGVTNVAASIGVTNFATEGTDFLEAMRRGHGADSNDTDEYALFAAGSSHDIGMGGASAGTVRLAPFKTAGWGLASFKTACLAALEPVVRVARLGGAASQIANIGPATQETLSLGSEGGLSKGSDGSSKEQVLISSNTAQRLSKSSALLAEASSCEQGG